VISQMGSSETSD